MTFALRSFSLRALLAPLALSVGLLAGAPASAEFRGGGYLSQVNAACATAGLTPGENIPIRLRYTPAATSTSWTRFQVNFLTRLESISYYGPLLTSRTTYEPGLGYSLWAHFRAYVQRPRMRAFVVDPVHPSGATLANASEVRLRVEFRHFASVEGCFVTLNAVVRR